MRPKSLGRNMECSALGINASTDAAPRTLGYIRGNFNLRCYFVVFVVTYFWTSYVVTMPYHMSNEQPRFFKN